MFGLFKKKLEEEVPQIVEESVSQKDTDAQKVEQNSELSLYNLANGVSNNFSWHYTDRGRPSLLDKAKALIDAGADVNFTNSDGTSIFCVAVEKNRSALISLLLEKGVNTDKIDEYLLLAVEKNYLDIAKILLTHGAKFSQTFIDDAIENDDYEKIKFYYKVFDKSKLFSQTQANLLIHKVAQNGDVEMMHSLLESDADIESTDKEGNTPLMIAAIYAHQALIDLLKERGAKQDRYNEFIKKPCDFNTQDRELLARQLLMYLPNEKWIPVLANEEPFASMQSFIKELEVEYVLNFLEEHLFKFDLDNGEYAYLIKNHMKYGDRENIEFNLDDVILRLVYNDNINRMKPFVHYDYYEIDKIIKEDKSLDENLLRIYFIHIKAISYRSKMIGFIRTNNDARYNKFDNKTQPDLQYFEKIANEYNDYIKENEDYLEIANYFIKYMFLKDISSPFIDENINILEKDPKIELTELGKQIKDLYREFPVMSNFFREYEKLPIDMILSNNLYKNIDKHATRNRFIVEQLKEKGIDTENIDYSEYGSKLIENMQWKEYEHIPGPGRIYQVGWEGNKRWELFYNYEATLNTTNWINYDDFNKENTQEEKKRRKNYLNQIGEKFDQFKERAYANSRFNTESFDNIDTHIIEADLHSNSEFYEKYYYTDMPSNIFQRKVLNPVLHKYEKYFNEINGAYIPIFYIEALDKEKEKRKTLHL